MSGGGVRLNERTLAGLLSGGEAQVLNHNFFFTVRDRATQINDEYSLKAEVWQNGNKIAVIHAHVEDQQNVVTKAHVKSDHYGFKLFDLSPDSMYSGLILGYLVQGRYRVALD